MSKAPRRLIPISEELVTKIIRVSERLGIPFRDLLESMISSLLDIIEYDRDVVLALDSVDAIKDLLRISGLLLPRDAVYRIIDRMSDEDIEEIIRELRHTCRWYAELVKVKRGASPRELKTLLGVWFPDCSVDIRASDRRVRIVVSSVNQPEKVTRIVKEVSIEFLRSLGYRVVSAESREGIVSLVVEVGSREEGA